MQHPSALHGRHRPCAAHTQRVGSNTFSARSRGALLVLAAVKQRSAREVVISKTLIARPDAKDKVWTLCEEASARAKAAMADRNVGLRAFDCVRDGWDDNVFHFWERYESNVALGRYNSSEPVLEWYKQVSPLLEQPVGMAMYEWKDGQLGAVCVQDGHKGEGGLDDATGASGAAGGAGLKQTSSAVDLTQIDDEEDEAMIMDGLSASMADVTQKVSELGKNLADNLLKVFGAKK